jgi:hypothetical protein
MTMLEDVLTGFMTDASTQRYATTMPGIYHLNEKLLVLSTLFIFNLFYVHIDVRASFLPHLYFQPAMNLLCSSTTFHEHLLNVT